MTTDKINRKHLSF